MTHSRIYEVANMHLLELRIISRAAQDASVNLRTWVLMHKVLDQLLPPLAFNTSHMLHC